MPVFPGGAGPNTFVPSFEDSNRLKFEYSRDPKKFPVLQWCAMKSVKRTQGKYLDLGSAAASRVLSPNDFLWAYGADRPDRSTNLEQFDFKSFLTKRYNTSFHVPYEVAEEADWDLVAWQSRIVAQQLMTLRTYNALTTATTTGNWPTSNTGSATALGGKWSSSDATHPYILTTLLTAAQEIHKATQGAVTPSMINVIIDPPIAKVVRTSYEIIDVVKQTQQAIALMENREFFDTWGIPKNLYGFNWVVEDAVRTTSKKGATDAKSYMLGGDTVILTANSMNVGNYKASELPRGDDMGTFDTLTCFLKEDMTVETKNDQDNRRIHGHVVDNYDIQVTCGKSGYLMTDVL